MDIRQILDAIPHRYPFLLVDRILENEPGRVVGLKNVTINEPFFQGHFPGLPIMPGVLIVEAMAQVAAAGLMASGQFAGKIGLFTGIDKVRFRRQVVPGDQLRIEVEDIKVKGMFGKCRARALVEGEVAAEGELLFAIVDRP